MHNSRWVKKNIRKHLPGRISQLYYSHGVICSSHPFSIIAFTFAVVLLCCYPLFGSSLLGNSPKFYMEADSLRMPPPPKWVETTKKEKFYVQQVIVRSAVSPWTADLVLTDAFRAPIQESFTLLEIIQDYQVHNRTSTLDDYCVRIESVSQTKDKYIPILPEYNCLILSPANLWNGDESRFRNDASIINTIFNHQNLAKNKISMTEILFGLSLRDTGIKRYPLRNKPRFIQFAVTIFLKKYEKAFGESLRNYISDRYSSIEIADISLSNASMHIFYPEDVDYLDYLPLFFTYVAIFVYVYFSVRKMDHVSSKIFMAFGALLSVVASFCMTVGICFFFGIEYAGKGQAKQIFPYLVIVVGLENILVLTRSVVSTAPYLDAKIRVAQGLSKEGWNITKNLLIEVTILTIGLFTFYPAVQEFCILAIIGLLSDFFSQIFFFSIVLCIDIRRVDEPSYKCYPYYSLAASGSTLRHSRSSASLSRSRSHPRLRSKNVVARDEREKTSRAVIPKREKIVYFWARVRFVQRSFKFFMIIWIAGMIYKTDVVGRIATKLSNESVQNRVDLLYKNVTDAYRSANKLRLLRDEKYDLKASRDVESQIDIIEKIRTVKYDTRRRISLNHWSSILKLYDISAAGKCIQVLPPIYVGKVLTPELAKNLQNPGETGAKFRWESLAIVLDPIDFSIVADEVPKTSYSYEDYAQPFIPISPIGILLVGCLCVISVLVLVYGLITLYRITCSPSYAEWRSNWIKSLTYYYPEDDFVVEIVPINVDGHSQQIECITSNGNIVASSCLAGNIKIWDVFTGELINNLVRSEIKDKYLNEVNEDVSYHKGARNDCYYQTNDRPNDQSISNGLFKFNGISESIASSNFYQYDGGANATLNVTLPNPYRNHNGVNVSSNVTSFNLYPSDVGVNMSRNVTSSNPYSNEGKVINFTSSNPYRNDIRTNTTTDCKKSTNNLADNFYRAIPVWSMDCKDNILVVGDARGNLEFWDCFLGTLLHVTPSQGDVSLIGVKLVGKFVVTGTLDGTLLTYGIDTCVDPPLDCPATLRKSKRNHVRTSSAGSIVNHRKSDGLLTCRKLYSVKAHDRPLVTMDVENRFVITGSEDCTVKVFKLEDLSLLFTLYGHKGAITCAFIDKITRGTAASGSQDGLLCMWDLISGECVYNVQAHDGSICALSYSVSYIISLGFDERICIFDRFQGHLLNTIEFEHSFCNSMSMLTHNFLVTSECGGLVVIDVRSGDVVKRVKFSRTNAPVFVKQIMSLGESVICDYGDQIRLVRFPFVSDKTS